MSELNETHDVSLESWVTSANDAATDFPIQNLPFCVFRKRGTGENYRVGVGIGNQIVDFLCLSAHSALPQLNEKCLQALCATTLNEFMALGHSAWRETRQVLSLALRAGAPEQDKLSTCLVEQSDAEFSVPATIGDYTDFYTSINHANNVGKLFRPDQPLLPNYQWIPIGYHGRSSSIGVSGQTFHRPVGQLKAPDSDKPVLAPSKKLDYELEVGIFIGSGNDLGSSICIDDADQHVFGLCLLNDWSARDIQAWEYQPLGPFLSKSFASTISPWIVTHEALAPFREKWNRPNDHPQPLSYLDSEIHRNTGAFGIELELYIETELMRAKQEAPQRLTQSNFRDSYWSVAQMVAHHTVNGCNLRPGDFFGSGTQSGTTTDSAGALIEITEGGKNPITLENGEQRTFLEDGDKIIIRGSCSSDGGLRIGFGEATGTVLSANTPK